MKKVDIFLLALVLFLGTLLRLYKINIPLADLHSWRQADTAAVARNFVKSGFDLLHPLYDDLSNVQSGQENPKGYRMVEFPIYNSIFAKLYQIWPSTPIEVWGRVVSIFFSLVVISVIYYLTLKEASRTAAFFASLIYAVFPFFIFFSRVVLPETAALGFSMLSIFLLYLNPSSAILYLGSAIFFAAALLVKPTTIFFALPLAYLFFKNYKWKIVKNISFYFYFFISALPLILWRIYIRQYPEGVPVSEWLITSVNTGGGLQKIFFRPAFFRWIFFERINNLILGGLAAGFLIIGTLTKQKKKFLSTILVASLGYVFVFQGGNVQHEYYQTLILPALAIFLGVGIDTVFQNKKIFSPFISYLGVFIILAFSWFFSFYNVRNFYNYSAELIQTANIIKSLTPPGDLIVTDTTGDTTLLYLSDRRGAPAVYKDPLELQKLGYKFITTNNAGMVNQLTENNFELVFQNEKLAIFKL